MTRLILPSIALICALMTVCLIAFGGTAGLIVLGLLVPVALSFGGIVVALRWTVDWMAGGERDNE